MKPVEGFVKKLPLIFATISLVVLIKNLLLSYGILDIVLATNPSIGVFISTLFGSVLAGNPSMSYVLGGYLYKQGLNLIAVTSFLIAWVTVGVLQIPVEKKYFPFRFVIIRNILSFLFSIVAAILLYCLLHVLYVIL